MLLGLDGLKDNLPGGETLSIEREAARLNSAHVEQVFDEAIHPPRRFLDGLRALFQTPRPFGLTVSNEGRMHQDGRKGIAEVMRHDAEHFVTQPNRPPGLKKGGRLPLEDVVRWEHW